MTFHLESLEFNKEYDFDITVEYKEDSFAGHLSLRDNSVLLKVFGEQGEERRGSLPWENIKIVRCRDSNATIILLDLRLMSGMSRTVSHQPPRSYFESTYEVGNVIFSKSYSPSNLSFSGIKIHSDTISKWIGNTKKQENIIEMYYSRELFNSNKEPLEEFSCYVAGKGQIGVTYSPIAFHNSPEFKAGVRFPPSLVYLFDSKLDVEEAIEISKVVITFFTFITGGHVEIDKIELLIFDGLFSKPATLYFPRHGRHRGKDNYIFYPLGKNLRFNSIGLPEFPLESISNFFSQDARKIKFFTQYLKYRGMESDEERFLGYFRLLEAIAYKDGKYLDEDILREVMGKAKPYLIRKFGDKKNVTTFLKRIPSWNAAKHNVERCLVDLFNDVPASVSGEWRYGAGEFRAICKLRNDITHANDYEVSSATVAGFTRYLEILVVYSLLVQIRVEISSAAAILHRLEGYHEVRRNDA